MDEEGEKVTTFEYICRTIDLLQEVERIRIAAQQRLDNGLGLGDPTEFTQKARYFSLVAQRLVPFAESVKIDSSALDQLLRTGNPYCVEGAFRVLRQLQGWALNKEAELKKSQVGQPTGISPVSKVPISNQALKQCAADALMALHAAVRRDSALNGADDEEIYEAIRVNPVEVSGEQYRLPKQTRTWKRYLRAARKAAIEQQSRGTSEPPEK
jgi:hypothetical protein